jgi:molybdopterin/thiamine biosynthesis adenylyltransferase
MTSQPTTRRKGIDNDEAALYDRQIRLWGIEAQNRLVNSHIALFLSQDCAIGSFAGEVAKNCVLAGIGRLTFFLQETLVRPSDLSCSGFLLLESDVGKNAGFAFVEALKKLNPRVHISLRQQGLAELLSTQTFSQIMDDLQPSCVVLCNAPFGYIQSVDEVVREKNIQLFAGGVYGMLAYYLVDLGDAHEYTSVSRLAGKEGQTVSTTSVHTDKLYVSLRKLTVQSENFTRYHQSFGLGFEKVSRHCQGVANHLGVGINKLETAHSKRQNFRQSTPHKHHQGLSLPRSNRCSHFRRTIGPRHSQGHFTQGTRHLQLLHHGRSFWFTR